MQPSPPQDSTGGAFSWIPLEDSSEFLVAASRPRTKSWEGFVHRDSGVTFPAIDNLFIKRGFSPPLPKSSRDNVDYVLSKKQVCRHH